MKKLLLISSLLLTVAGCKDTPVQENSNDSVAQQQEIQAETLSDYEAAKATLDELFLHAERLKKGEISKEKHAAISYPIGQKFKFQKAALNEEDRQKLKEYGLERFDDLYPEEDRKVATSN